MKFKLGTKVKTSPRNFGIVCGIKKDSHNPKVTCVHVYPLIRGKNIGLNMSVVLIFDKDLLERIN